MMQLPPPMLYQEHDTAEIEAREEEIKRDFAGDPLLNGYWVAWMIIIVLDVVGYVLLGVLFHLI